MTLWPPRAQHVDEPRAARGVELAHHVVEQHQRRGAALGGQRLALGQQQREQPEPLLAPRAVGAQLAAVAAERQVVAVRAVAGEAALEVRVGALGQLGRQRLRRRRPSSAGGTRARPRPRARAPPACSAKRPRSRSTTSARSRISAIPWRASSASQAGSEPRPARPARTARSARCAARAPPSTRAACRRAPATARRRPGRCARAAAPAPRAPAPAGRAGRRPRAAAPPSRSAARPARRRPAAASARPAGTRRRARAGRARPRSRAPAASAASPKRTTSRSFAVRHDRPVQAKYSASSRFVLPAPLRPVMTVSRGPRPQLSRRVGAEVALSDEPAASTALTRSAGSA